MIIPYWKYIGDEIDTGLRELFLMVFYETTATALKEVIIFRPRTITVFQLSVYYQHFPSL